MKQLRRLSEIHLQLTTRTKQANGSVVSSYSDIGTYNVIPQEITEEMYATIYGANISNMLRISSVHSELETLLKSKSTDTADNLSLYFILIGNKRYKIKAVTGNWVDIEFYETNRTV